MDCKTSRDRLPLYAGGDLPSGDMADLQTHLDACRECSGELASYRECLDGLAAIRDVAEDPASEPVSVWPAVHERLRDCLPVIPRLAEYAADELPADRAAALARHLEGCPSCGEILDEEREARHALGSLRRVPTPAGHLESIWDGVREGLARETLLRSSSPVIAEPSAPHRTHRLFRAAAALLVGVVAGWTGVAGMRGGDRRPLAGPAAPTAARLDASSDVGTSPLSSVSGDARFASDGPVSEPPPLFLPAGPRAVAPEEENRVPDAPLRRSRNAADRSSFALPRTPLVPAEEVRYPF